MKEFLTSLILKNAVIVLAGLLVVLLAFAAGVYVGSEQARFSYGYGEHFFRVFGDDRVRGMPLPFESFADGHGAAGKIISIALPTFVVEGPDGIEKVIVTNDDTEIRRFRETLAPEDLKASDFAVIIGSPNDKSQVVARLIRIMPPPENATTP
jgi:hypothetical protein